MKHVAPNQDRDEHRDRPWDDQQGSNDAPARQVVEHDRGDESHSKADKDREKSEGNIPKKDLAKRFAESFVCKEVSEVPHTNGNDIARC